jgi:hypothetical protein
MTKIDIENLLMTGINTTMMVNGEFPLDYTHTDLGVEFVIGINKNHPLYARINSIAAAYDYQIDETNTKMINGNPNMKVVLVPQIY